MTDAIVNVTGKRVYECIKLQRCHFILIVPVLLGEVKALEKVEISSKADFLEFLDSWMAGSLFQSIALLCFRRYRQVQETEKLTANL